MYMVFSEDVRCRDVLVPTIKRVPTVLT